MTDIQDILNDSRFKTKADAARNWSRRWGRSPKTILGWEQKGVPSQFNSRVKGAARRARARTRTATIGQSSGFIDLCPDFNNTPIEVVGSLSSWKQVLNPRLPNLTVNKIGGGFKGQIQAELEVHRVGEPAGVTDQAIININTESNNLYGALEDWVAEFNAKQAITAYQIDEIIACDKFVYIWMVGSVGWGSITEVANWK